MVDRHNYQEAIEQGKESVRLFAAIAMVIYEHMDNDKNKDDLDALLSDTDLFHDLVTRKKIGVKFVINSLYVKEVTDGRFNAAISNMLQILRR